MLQLPTAEIYVRILGKRSGKVLIDNNDGSGLTHQDKEPVKGEQWWRVIPGQGKKYMIKNVTTGRVIWCRQKSRRAGCIEGDGKYDDNWFTFEETKLPGCQDTFRIKCAATDSVLVSRVDRKPEVDGFGVKSDGSPDYEDHHFSFLFDDMEVKEIIYDTKKGTTSGEDGKPLIIATREFKNGGSVEQTQVFNHNQEKSDEESFEHSHGFNISIGYKFKVGSYPIYNNEWDITFSQTNEIKWGEKHIKTEKWGLTETIKIPPKSKVTAKFVGRHMEISVPFKMIWKSKTTGEEQTTHGVYKGVNSYYTETEVVEEKWNPTEIRELDDGETYPNATKENREMISEETADSQSGDGQVYYEEGTYESERRYDEYDAQGVEEVNDPSCDPDYNPDYVQEENYQADGTYEENQAFDNREDQHEGRMDQYLYGEGEDRAGDEEDSAERSSGAHEGDNDTAKYYDDQTPYENSEQQSISPGYNEEGGPNDSYNREERSAVDPEQNDPYKPEAYGTIEEEPSQQPSYEAAYGIDNDEGNNEAPTNSDMYGSHELGESTPEVDGYDSDYKNRAYECEGDENDGGDSYQRSTHSSGGYEQQHSYNEDGQYDQYGEGETEESEGGGVRYHVAYRQYGTGDEY